MALERKYLELTTPDNGFYDQIVGMSQGIINKSFKDMFDSVLKTDKTVCKLFLSTKKEGTINAELDAPSVILMGNAMAMVEVWYLLRIKSGTVDLKSGRKVSLAGWSFAVSTPLKKITLSPTDEDNPDLKATKLAAMKDLGEKYKGFVPGDYRVQRVFCALAQAGWSEPDGFWSTAYENGEKMKLSEWKAKYEGDCDNLLDLLWQWAKKQKDERLSSLGIIFELDQKKQGIPEPTFKPVEILTQVYPYRTTQFPKGQNGYGEYGPNGKFVDADYNCLMYCEMVHSGNAKHPWLPDWQTRKLPSQPKLNWSSNFAQPSSQGDEIPGTFAMDRRVWLEAFVLPQLQEICQATKLTCGAGRQYDDDGHKMSSTYALGCPLSGEPHISAADATWRFERVQDGRFERVQDGHYQWKSTSYAPNNGNVYEYYTTWYQPNYFNRFYYHSENEVNVKWDAGSTTFRISGEVFYQYETTFANDRGITRDLQFKKYKVKGSWSFDIKILDPEEVVVKLEVDRSGFKAEIVDGRSYMVPNGFKVEASDDECDGVTGTSTAEIKSKLSVALSNGIDSAATNIERLFTGAGKFTFPGYGALKFKKPLLTEQGNLVATAEYTSTNANGTINFPDPSIVKLEPPSRPEPLTSQFPSAQVDMGKPQLHWSMDFKYDPASKNGRLSFTGTNENSNEPLRFDYIRVLLIPQTTIDTRLFPSREWKPESKSWIAKAIKTIRDNSDDLLSWFKYDDEPSQDASTTTGGHQGDKVPQEEKAPQEEKTPQEASTTTGGQQGEKVLQDEKAPQGEKGPQAQESEVGRRPKKKGAEPTPRPSRIRDDNVYGFATSQNWTGEKDLALEVESLNNLALDALLSRPGDDNPFTVARGQSITIILQGRVSGTGNYQIKVQEEWASPPGKEKSTQDLTTSWDWKMVQIFDDGKSPEYFDLSDKAEEIERARAK